MAQYQQNYAMGMYHSGYMGSHMPPNQMNPYMGQHGQQHVPNRSANQQQYLAQQQAFQHQIQMR